MQDFEVSNSNVPQSISVSSIDSVPEISKANQFCFKVFFICVSIVSLILGIKLLIEKEIYILKEFEEYNFLFVYIVIYSFGFLTSLFFSISISLVIYLISKIIFCFKKRKEIKNELDALIEEDVKISFISYSFAILIIMLILLYLFGVIFGIYLLVKIQKNKYYKDYIHYFWVYCFIVLNIFIGFSLIFIFLYVMICSKIKASIRQKNIKINDKELNNIQKEIEEAFQQYQHQ